MSPSHLKFKELSILEAKNIKENMGKYLWYFEIGKTFLSNM